MIIFNNIINNFFFRLIYKPKKVTFDGNGTLHFFPFISLVLSRLYNKEQLRAIRYTGTTWLKNKYKNITYFNYFPRFLKTIHLFLDVDECEYDLYYCEANSYCSNTVGSYICTTDRKYRLEQQWIQVNMNHRFPNCSGTKWYIKQQHKDINPRSSYLFC